jgi:hypothetical protein
MLVQWRATDQLERSTWALVWSVSAPGSHNILHKTYMLWRLSKVWDDVYAALEPHGVIVVGGRVTGVGVGGFTLGGGYSWLSNQYGSVTLNVLLFHLAYSCMQKSNYRYCDGI